MCALDVCSRRVAELSKVEITFQYQHRPAITIASCPRSARGAGPRPPAFPGCDVSSGASGAQGERGLSRSYSEGSVQSAPVASQETALLQDIFPEQAPSKTGES